MIQMFHVYKSYDKGSTYALDDITLHVKKGEFVFITGPSGAGKSSLLNIMFGLEEPYKGQMIIDGRNYFKIPQEEIPAIRRRIGFVFQDFKLPNNKSVYDNIALGLKVMGLGPREIKKRVQKVLGYVRLTHRANFKPLALSGGEQQRVAIARALVKEPAILLADEPTGNLDVDLSFEIMDLFKEINSRGTTVVVATHSAEILNKYSRRIIHLEEGAMVEGAAQPSGGDIDL